MEINGCSSDVSVVFPPAPNMYKATQFWNEAIRTFYEQMPVTRHRLKLKFFDRSFTVSEALDWLCLYLSQKERNASRENALRLLEKFYERGLFKCVCCPVLDHKLRDESITLFRFCQLSPSKVARTPLALKSRSYVNHLLSQNSSSTSELCSKSFCNLSLTSKPTRNCPVTPLRYGRINEVLALKECTANHEVDTSLQKQSLPQLHLVARNLTKHQVESIWLNTAKQRLKELLKPDQATDDQLFEKISSTFGVFVQHNASQFSTKGLCRVSDKNDDIPRHIFQAMKCIANWPWENSVLNWSAYAGCEHDVFRTIVDYYYTNVCPFFPYELIPILAIVLEQAERPDGDDVTNFGENVVEHFVFGSQETMFVNPLAEEAFADVPRPTECFPMAEDGGRQTAKNKFHLETEFAPTGHQSPVTRLFVPPRHRELLPLWATSTCIKQPPPRRSALRDLCAFRRLDTELAATVPTLDESESPCTSIMTDFVSEFKSAVPTTVDDGSPLSEYFTSLNCLSPTTATDALKTSAKPGKFDFGGKFENSKIRWSRSLISELEKNPATTLDELQDILSSLPGLIKSPELMRKFAVSISMASCAKERYKATTRIAVLNPQSPYDNVPRNRASLATVNALDRATFAQQKYDCTIDSQNCATKTTTGNTTRGYHYSAAGANPGAYHCKGKIAATARCRHSIATASVSANVSQYVRQGTRTSNSNGPITAKQQRYSVASEWSADELMAATATPAYANANAGHSLASETIDEEGFVARPEGLQVAIECLKICCLFLSPKNRRHLQLLLRLMTKVASNHCLKLDKRRRNRALVIDTFSECLAQKSEAFTKSKLEKLLTLLLDYQIEVFATPVELKTLVQTRIDQAKTARICYTVESADNLRYCANRVSQSQFDCLKTSESERALFNLLEFIVADENMKQSEKRKKLQNFSRSHPELFQKKFPTQESFQEIFLDKRKFGRKMKMKKGPTASAQALAAQFAKFKKLRA